jgi:hypothetical protein
MKTKSIRIPTQKKEERKLHRNHLSSTFSLLIARNATQPSKTRRKSPLHPRKSTYPDEPAVPPCESYPH